MIPGVSGNLQDPRTNMWREFDFFEVTPIRDPQPGELYSDPELLAIAPGDSNIYLSTRTRVVKEIDKELCLKCSFEACPPGYAVNILKSVPDTRIVLTVASQEGQPCIVSLWDLGRLHSDGKPQLHSSTTVTNGKNMFPITSFCMSTDASVLVLGYADGAVIVVRGDILHDRGARQRVVYTAPSPITGLELINVDEWSQVFVVSLNQVACVSTTGRLAARPIVLDTENGAEHGCTTQLNDQLVVGREAELCFYSLKHRGMSLEFHAKKKRLLAYKHYLFMVTVFTTSGAIGIESNRVVIIDTRNKFVAYSGLVKSQVKHVFVLQDSINVLNAEGVLYQFKELSLSRQIAILQEQKLFQNAITMAKNGSAPDEQIYRLHQAYGEYLYTLGDSENALKHFIAAIPLGESSHVIIRYQESMNVEHLVTYLETLFASNRATSQHLVVLGVCYVNIGDKERLRSFLARAVKFPSFDFESVIKVCRSGRFYSFAALLAEKWPDSDLAVRIRLYDMKDYRGCLDYISHISVTDALRILIQNSSVLLDELPVETTGILISLFTGRFIPHAEGNLISRDTLDNDAPNSEKLGMKNVSSENLETVPPTSVQKGNPAISAALQSYQAFLSYLGSSNYNNKNLVSAQSLTPAPPSYQPPRPRLIFPAFIKHQHEFVVFLEACIESAPTLSPSAKDMSDMLSALYEAYLQLHVDEKDDWLDKAQKLLVEHSDVLSDNIIFLVSQLHAVELSADIQAKLGISYENLFRLKIESGDYATAKEMLDANVKSVPELIPLAVKLFTSSEPAFQFARPWFSQFLEKSITESRYPAVYLLETICSSEFVTIGDIKPFLLKLISDVEKEESRNLKIADSYATEAVAKREELYELMNKPQIIEYGLCSACNLPLDLPAVHFACKHSYHRRCLGGTLICRICLSENESVEALRSSQEEATQQQEVFFKDLTSRPDKMTAINQFISRGGLSSITTEP